MNHQVQDPVVRTVKERERFFCPISDCPHERAVKKGYLTYRGYKNHFMTYHLQSETVGFMSRLDWGSPGFRKGLIYLAFKHFRQEKVRFIVLAGGLVSFPHLKPQLTKTSLRALANEYGFKDIHDKDGTVIVKATDRAQDRLFDEWVTGIDNAIPQLRIKGRKFVRIYIVTSPAPNYDGWVGSEIARRLARRRPDIRFWGERSVRFPLKLQNKVIWVLNPLKASWRGKYFSTAVDRLIEDELKQTSQSLPDLWVVGCTASSLQRPEGEKPRPHISLPALHKLQEVHTAENQVGIRVVEFIPQTDRFLVRNYTFKDHTANERQWIPKPESANKLQRRIVSTLRESGPSTIGMLEDALGVPRGQISDAISKLNKKGYEPQIQLDEDSQLYDFCSWWIQNRLAYPMGDPKELREETILGFGCLHAGSIFSEYRFFVEEVPKLILQHGTTVLVGAGDFIEGLEWDLDKKGETMRGWNYTQQESLAAHMISSVMLKVFRVRLEEGLQGFKKRKPSAERLKAITETALPTFFYKEGNHDGWLKRKGITPLSKFRPALVRCLVKGIEKILSEHGLELSGLDRIAISKVVYGEVHQLPSGLGLTIRHPHMARALTSSLRAQHTLASADTPIVVLANFHVAIAVEQWDSGQGQRVALQAGAIVWRTSFEHLRLKRLDIGVGHLRVLSNQEGRIVMTETAFFGGGDRIELKNELLLDNFMAELGIES
ncbi:MAG: hypothetical protein BMS9Abin34_160 [Patescibacteria group bacterium]|nr:MAG: hypothetical protein BMS9Abin34_160 [Patescibacteria group bacterium]